MLLTNEELLEIYQLLLLTRRNDERVCEIYARRGLPELPHSCQGEEQLWASRKWVSIASEEALGDVFCE